MRTIPKERILRVNCPGYGVEANFNLGNAKPLNNYSAIIVNPTSIAHLFDKDPELVRRIDSSLAEGHTTYKLEDDLILRNIAAEAESRILELSDFLTQGGFLVYFLSRPFVLKSPSVSVDNYYWLETLAPDQPLEQNVRHMSAVAQGRLVEVTEKGEQSDLAPYLRQPGLEWSTIIRDDFLTDGYHLLATAGPNKCIAGQLYIMQSNGRVAFLPAPFSPDFDRTLIECLNRWYASKDPSPEELAAEQREAEELAAAEENAPVAVPSQGPQLFDRDQGEPDQAIFNIQPDTPSAQEPTPEPQIYGAPEPIEAQPAASVETPPVTPQVEPEKPATQEIDLSIFAKTARQLVQKANEDTLVEVPEVPPAPEPEPEPEPVTMPVPQAGPPDLINATDAVDSSIAGKIASDLIQESLQLEPPGQTSAPVPEENPPVPVIESQEQYQPEHAENDNDNENEIATQTNGEVTVTNNENLQDEQTRKLKAMEALKELQLSHPAAAPAAAPPQPTPPGHAVPPQVPPAAAAAPAPAPAPAPTPQPVQHSPGNNQAQQAKPLLNSLFKQAEPASQTPAPQPVRQTNHVDLPVPDWCKAFSFSYLDDLRMEQTALNEQLQSVQAKLNTVESRIASVEQLKQALLAGEPGVLIDACNTVLSRLGWTVRKSDRVANEILLSNVDHPEGLARVVRSDDQCGRTEVAQLAESAISFWDEHEIEPKGVLIACTWATQSPSQRTQPDFSDSLRKFAEKKNLCLMTAMQLLGIYRDIELGATSPDVVRKQILETSGQLSGYEVEKGVVQAGAAV